MNTTRAKSTRGFTIIEVVLVLAIAGLIFLMVFIALPTLQRNQRDTQRRSDLSRFQAQINQYQANNKGDTPINSPACAPSANTNVSGFINRYMQNWNDPLNGNPYPCAGTAANATASTAAPGTWFYRQNGKCNGENVVAASGNREFAIVMKLEGSGVACQDNQ